MIKVAQRVARLSTCCVANHYPPLIGGRGMEKESGVSSMNTRDQSHFSISFNSILEVGYNLLTPHTCGHYSH